MTTYSDYIGAEDIKFWDGISRTFTRQTSTGGTITLNKIGEMVNILDVYGSGSVYTDATISEALTHIGTRNVGIFLTPGTWTISNNITIPSTIDLWIPPGAVFSIASGKTLTLNAGINAGVYQIFSGSGTVIFGGGKKCAYPQWWGAKGDGTTDDSAASISAINSGCKVLIFPNGLTYLIKAKCPVPYTKTGLTLLGYGATIKGHTDLVNDFMFEFTGDTSTQNYHNKIAGFECDLNGAGGFLNLWGVHTTPVEDIYIRDTLFASSANTIGVKIFNSFNIPLRNIRVHKLNGSSGIGVQIKSDSGSAGFSNITNVQIVDGLIQRCYKNIDMNFGVGADTIKILNTGIGDDATPLGQYGIYVSGVVHQLDIDTLHCENVPTGIYVNGTEYSVGVKNSFFYNVADVYSFNGASSFGYVTVEKTRYTGTAQTPKYEIFAVNNADVLVQDIVNYASGTYTRAVGSGTGNIKTSARLYRDKTTNYTIEDAEENYTFTNKGAAGNITLTLPALSKVGVGFEASFRIESANFLFVDPNGTDQILDFTGGTGEYIGDTTVGSYISLVSQSNGWKVKTHYGRWRPETTAGTVIPVSYASAVPASGKYFAGEIVYKTNPALDGSNMTLLGWRRLTTGTAHVSGTDWALMYVSHVTPAT